MATIAEIRDQARAHIAAMEANEIIVDRDMLLDATFGPNPCQNLTFTNENTGDMFSTLCDSPRCPHCGPRKAALLWNGILQLLGGQCTAIAIKDDHHYKQLRDTLRKRRQRGAEVHYLSFATEDGQRLLLTNEHLDGSRRIQTASLKKAIVGLYQKGKAQLRKSWSEAWRVTLSHRSNTRKSVTSGWKSNYQPVVRYTWEQAKASILRKEQTWIEEHESREAWRSGHSWPTGAFALPVVA